MDQFQNWSKDQVPALEPWYFQDLGESMYTLWEIGPLDHASTMRMDPCYDRLGPVGTQPQQRALETLPSVMRNLRPACEDFPGPRTAAVAIPGKWPRECLPYHSGLQKTKVLND